MNYYFRYSISIIDIYISIILIQNAIPRWILTFGVWGCQGLFFVLILKGLLSLFGVLRVLGLGVGTFKSSFFIFLFLTISLDFTFKIKYYPYIPPSPNSNWRFFL